MPKLKTIKAISKRVKVSGGRKKTLVVRASGQDHFNARESGKTSRNKRRNNVVAKVNEKTTRRAIQKFN